MKTLLKVPQFLIIPSFFLIASCGMLTKTSKSPTAASTDPATPIPPTSAAATYAVAAPLLKKYCATAGCHDSVTHSSNYDASTQQTAALKAAIASAYMKGMGDIMPQGRGLINNTDEGKTLLKWFDAGAPN